MNGSTKTAISGTIDNDGFWPDIALHSVAAALALEHVPTTRLEQGVLDAMAELNCLLRPFKQRSRAQGYITVEQVPIASPRPAGTLSSLYRRALYCQVGASLCPRWARQCRVTAADYQRSRNRAVCVLLEQA
ncbi:head completion/stabilization protein [Pseudomonas sp. DC3000-4b1]|uniref:head completion/stabilization protein n=1 Tax=unclassified Pseudomonas TaxID=196821 RepID=UPI003CF656FE